VADVPPQAEKIIHRVLDGTSVAVPAELECEIADRPPAGVG
jgi:hypothetical protein